ncbi:MAG: polysaccharide biosynthesis tyrosine autokinase [Lachnospiraceae bacterium]
MERERNEIQEQLKLDITTMIFDVLRNWWVILLGVLTAMMLTYVVVNETYVPKYTTRATFVVGSKGDFNASSNLYSANNMAKTFQRILQSNVMKKIICEELEIDQLTDEIRAQVIENTNLLVLTVTADSPKEAIDLIHTVMDNYTSVSYYTAGNAVMDVLEEPSIPMSPDNPLHAREKVKQAAFAAFLILCALFAFCSYMRDTIKQEEDIERKLDARNLGSISYERKNKMVRDILKRDKRALLSNDPLAGFAFVEGYKKLATKVDYQMSKENRKVLVVTSVSENEGKSTAAANLAICLAEQSKKVMLIDGDFRRPSQFLIFNKKVRSDQEIGEVLKGNADAADAFLKTNIPNLFLMLGKNCYSSSTEMVQSVRMKQILDVCRRNMDYVIIDSPPTGLMGDAEALAGYSDAVMLIVKQNYIYSEDINDVLDSFREHHSEVLGVVLNGVKNFSSIFGSSKFRGHYGTYGHYGRYGRYDRYGNYAKNREKS